MQSILMAISDIIASVLDRFKPKPKPKKVEVKPVKTDVPEGYRPLFFHCWLCDGITKFACKNSISDRKFKIDCSRCGVENVVTVGTRQKK